MQWHGHVNPPPHTHTHVNIHIIYTMAHVHTQVKVCKPYLYLGFLWQACSDEQTPKRHMLQWYQTSMCSKSVKHFKLYDNWKEWDGLCDHKRKKMNVNAFALSCEVR